MPLAAVLDTNVALDLLVWADPAVHALAAALERGEVVAWADARTLAELAHVLARPGFRLTPEAQQACLARYRGWVRLASDEAAAPPPLPRCADRDDQKFLELAARVGAAWLVTKDKQLLQLDGWQGQPFLLLHPRRLAERLAPALAGR